MNDRDIDELLGELLRNEAPVPEHREGYRESVAALLTAEDVARAQRKGRRRGRARPAPDAVEERRIVVRQVSRHPARSHRLALVAALAFLLLLVVSVGAMEPLQRLLSPTMVLRITDETIVDVDNPAATRTTVVATSLVSLSETKDLIHDLIDAINANDTEAVGKLYATNGWVENGSDGTSIQGSVGIRNYWRDVYERLGLRVQSEGDPLPYDRYVTQPVRYLLPGEAEGRTGLFVFQIDTHGQIAHQWITGWVGQ
ncbi:MAG: hypothetical protein M1389_12295 [Chloroflexi bacterium]|nr:hypothetical protein [Chloroflexota bacterium]